jgi:hypothetical protein
LIYLRLVVDVIESDAFRIILFYKGKLHSDGDAVGIWNFDLLYHNDEENSSVYKKHSQLFKSNIDAKFVISVYLVLSSKKPLASVKSIELFPDFCLHFTTFTGANSPV